MNVFSQFWLSGGRHFGSLWGAIWSIILGERFWVSVGCHYGSAGGCPLGRLRAPIEQSWTLLPSRGFQEPPRGPKAPQSRYQRPHTGDACIATHRWRRMLCHASLLQYLQSKFFQSIENNFGIVSKIINLWNLSSNYFCSSLFSLNSNLEPVIYTYTYVRTCCVCAGILYTYSLR